MKLKYFLRLEVILLIILISILVFLVYVIIMALLINHHPNLANNEQEFCEERGYEELVDYSKKLNKIKCSSGFDEYLTEQVYDTEVMKSPFWHYIKEKNEH